MFLGEKKVLWGGDKSRERLEWLPITAQHRPKSLRRSTEPRMTCCVFPRPSVSCCTYLSLASLSQQPLSSTWPLSFIKILPSFTLPVVFSICLECLHKGSQTLLHIKNTWEYSKTLSAQGPTLNNQIRFSRDGTQASVIKNISSRAYDVWHSMRPSVLISSACLLNL